MLLCTDQSGMFISGIISFFLFWGVLLFKVYLPMAGVYWMAITEIYRLPIAWVYWLPIAEVCWLPMTSQLREVNPTKSQPFNPVTELKQSSLVKPPTARLRSRRPPPASWSQHLPVSRQSWGRPGWPAPPTPPPSSWSWSCCGPGPAERPASTATAIMSTRLYQRIYHCHEFKRVFYLIWRQ